ncbi:MAG: RNA methyltransferase [Acidobacteriota bacterium]|nr:MAG: RNA methyltransferase [Acidobacteriota bacterium]
MKNPWRRWRHYFRQLEELMRLAGERLSRDQADLAEENRLSRLMAYQRDELEREWVRRSLTIPFFRELVRASWRVDRNSIDEPVDRDFLRHWSGDKDTLSVSSQARLQAKRHTSPGESVTEDHGLPVDQPPLRLRTAEWALHQRTRSIVMVLDSLQDPLNASAVVRTAEALGLQEIHFCHAEGRVALNRAVHRGCADWLDLSWHRHAASCVERLKNRGYTVLAADITADAVSIEDVHLAPRMALVFGNEQAGLSDAFREHVDGFFFLPTVGFTSYLNVSVSAAMSLYTLDRRLRQAGLREPLSEEEIQQLRRAWYVALASGPSQRRLYLSLIENPPKPLEDVRQRPHRES